MDRDTSSLNLLNRAEALRQSLVSNVVDNFGELVELRKLVKNLLKDNAHLEHLLATRTRERNGACVAHKRKLASLADHKRIIKELNAKINSLVKRINGQLSPV